MTTTLIASPPPSNRRLTALAAALAALMLALPSAVLAQSRQCTAQTCTVHVTGNINGYHIQGCGGDYLRFHVRLTSTNPAVTFEDFGSRVLGLFFSTIPVNEKSLLEWRREERGWTDVGNLTNISFGTGAVNRDLTLDIRPKARAVIKGFGQDPNGGNAIGSGMMSFKINEVRANPKLFTEKLTSVHSFISTGEGCGRR